jgi:hypothetical protein
MQKHVLMLTTSAFVLACSSIAANAQQPPGVPMTQQPGQQQTQRQPTGQEDSSMMGPGGMMDRGMMGPGGMMGRGRMGPGGMMGHGMMGRGMMAQEGMMGRGTMGPPVMMRIIFSLMDSDGDGTISLQEFQAAHERIFKGMDANKDGRLTPEEMQAFMQGTRRAVPGQWDQPGFR